MLRNTSSAVIGLLMISGVTITSAATAARADAKAEVTAAAQKLADAENYSWTSSSEAAGGGGGGGGGGANTTAEGKAQKDGLVQLDLKLRNGSVQAFLQGDRGAIGTNDGTGATQWQSIAEAAASQGGGGGGGGGQGARRGGNPSRMIANLVKNYHAPAQQALDLAKQSTDLQKADDGSYKGTLSPDNAKALIQRRARGGDVDIKDAKATVTFHLDDAGELTGYQFNVQATIPRDGGDDIHIDRTTKVQIKDVGKTTIDVPAEAKAKMQ